MVFTQLHQIKYMLYRINFFIVIHNHVIVKIVTPFFYRSSFLSRSRIQLTTEQQFQLSHTKSRTNHVNLTIFIVIHMYLTLTIRYHRYITLKIANTNNVTVVDFLQACRNHLKGWMGWLATHHELDCFTTFHQNRFQIQSQEGKASNFSGGMP